MIRTTARPVRSAVFNQATGPSSEELRPAGSQVAQSWHTARKAPLNRWRSVLIVSASFYEVPHEQNQDASRPLSRRP